MKFFSSDNNKQEKNDIGTCETYDKNEWRISIEQSEKNDEWESAAHNQRTKRTREEREKDDLIKREEREKNWRIHLKVDDKKMK